MADDELTEEVERLRAENEALRRRGMTRERTRRASVVLLLVLGCGLAALSVVAIWLRMTLLDTDRYVETVAPIAAEPAVQNAVADKLNAAIDKRVDFAPLVREVLPDRADAFAPAIGSGLRSFVHSEVSDLVHSQRFEDLWVKANRDVHSRIVALLEGGRSKRLLLEGNTVYLDLSPAVDRIKSGLQERGMDRVAAAIPPSVDGRIQILQSDALVSAQRGVRLLKAVAIVLPVLSVLCLLGSVLLSRPWRRGLLHAAIGVALAMLVLVAALAFARSAYLDALGQGALPRDAASDIFDTLAVFLRDGLRIVIVAAVVVALISFLFGMPLGSLWRRLVTDSRRHWIGVHRNALLLVVAGLGGLALLVRDPLTGGYALVVLLIAAVIAGAIAALGVQTKSSVTSPDPGDATPPHLIPR